MSRSYLYCINNWKNGASSLKMFPLAHLKNWFIISLLKAIELKSDLRLYKFEKKIARTRNDLDDEGDSELRNVFGFVSDSFQLSKKKIDHGTDFNVLHKLVNDGTTENFILKSAFGFMGGILLTYLCYLFLIYSLNFTLRRATLICIGLGVILSLGLAFSVRIRCTILLCIPQLFSKRGRQALLAYAFILALSGPAKNTLHNVEVMSESLACGQEQLKKAENELLKCVHRPNAAVKQSLENMILKLDVAVKGYKSFIERFFKECEAVIETIIHAQEWLYSIYVLCNEKMGSPYSRCTDLLFEASQNCKAVSPAPDWTRACGISGVQDYICQTKDEPICSVEDLPPFWPFLNHRKQLSDLRKEAMNVIYVKIETRQIFTRPNRTATLREEYQGMATEIRQKTDQFLQYFDVMSVIFGIFIIVLFIKVIIYRYKFLTEDEYDNRFITSDFVDIDKTRAEFRMQTLLPLEPREKKKYIKVTSMRLVPYERARLLSSFIFLIFATFKIIIHMLTDCSLYWMLSTIRRHGRMLLVSSDEDIPQISITVNGCGIYADLLRNITKTVRPYAVQHILDPIPCLPDPISPDWNRYCQILTLVLICWLLALCEPYGLRLRHIVMVTYHPDRARERAIWLYNRILTTRINFVKFARRQLRRRYKDIDEETFFKPRFWIIKRRLKCLLCKEDLKDVEYIKCPTVGCVGIYCRPCFETLQLCSICKDPSYYGDYSDVSEEKDSEEEDKIPCSRCRCLSASQTYLRRGPVTDCYTFQMTYNPVPYVRNSTYPKFQISMDTIDDLDEKNTNQSQELLGEEKGNQDTPVMSPSLLTRLVHQCKRAFGTKGKTFDEAALYDKRKRKSREKGEKFNNVYFFTTTEDALKESMLLRVSRSVIHSLPQTKAEEGRKKSTNKRQITKKAEGSRKKALPPKESYDGKSKKSSKKTFQTKKKQKLASGALKSFAIFRWKLKDKLSEDVASGETTLLSSSVVNKEQFKNVYFVDVDPQKKLICRSDRTSSGKFKESSGTGPQMEGKELNEESKNEFKPVCPIHNKGQETTTSFLTSSFSERMKKGSESTRDRFSCHEQSHSEDCPLYSTRPAEDRTVLKAPGTDSALSKRNSRDKVPVIERWRHPKFRLDISQRRYHHDLNLECSDCTHSGEEQPSQISSLAELLNHHVHHPGLTDKETQTHPSESDAHTACTPDFHSATISERRDVEALMIPQENVNSSSPSSSTHCIIRKEVTAAKRRRQRSREGMKAKKFERRTGSASNSMRRLKRCSARYETTSDTSTEAKHVKSKRVKYRKPRMPVTMTDADIILMNSAQKVLSKKVDMMRAKLAKFFRKSIKRQSSSDDGGTTEMDNEEYLPMTADFLSEDEFQELSRKLAQGKSESSNRKLIQAPDLLSDLPSSKTPEPVLVDYQPETDLECEDCR